MEGVPADIYYQHTMEERKLCMRIVIVLRKTIC